MLHPGHVFALLLAACTSPAPGDAPADVAADTPGGVYPRVYEDADLTPIARIVEELRAEGLPVPTPTELRAELGEPVPPPSSGYDFEPPDTIRVWRSSMGGSSSCAGTVEVIAFEDYIKGVLPHEWIRSWETESLRAGAVAIRSYAGWWVNAGGKYTCADICDTTSCQVYDDARYSVTDDAVDDTEGEYAVEGDDVVFAEYSAENTGVTADGVSDPYCAGEALFGHGRGMCQWGSQRWALYGSKDHEWIVEHYYPDAQVVVVGVDEDGDGYSGDDCDDTDADIHPGADEYCNGDDDDCDGTTDESSAVDAPTWYRDADGDGFGTPDTSRRACDAPSGYVADDRDCDDTDARINPDAVELCDAIDNNCDGALDEGYDIDADGFRTCDGDCADDDPARHPGAAELLDDVDNNCDWRVDDGTIAYDDDGDGWTELAGDCADTEPMSFPGAPETADGQDDDCDGVTDEGTTARDDDGDGVTDAAGDCDDTRPTVYPGASEHADGLDGDCDGVVDEGTFAHDDDGDGWTEAEGDCDDTDRLAFPGALERVDGRDADCDLVADEGTVAFDDDFDGWRELDGDCDDAAPATFPGAVEVADGADNDCNALTDDTTDVFDDDHDAYTEAAGDCDDADPGTFPGANERVDGRDNDCNTFVDDRTAAYDDDGDGWTEAEHDCDDTRADVFPGAVERLDARDQDCDGLVDDETDAWDDDADGFTEQQGDCDDGNAHVFPAARERIDGWDGDCDGATEHAEGWFGCNSGGGGGANPAWILILAMLRRRAGRAFSTPQGPPDA